MRALRGAFLAAVLAGCGVTLAPPGPPPPPTGTPETIVARYYQALARICGTGVTPESGALYEAVKKIWEAEATGSGRGSNFGGARDPPHAW
ncbi:MAG: hypothetical protein HYR86_01625, partial [Candidatus Rokubacteria bacterium]|nr:hypothetical protein [Candidatus Rokubacteria bacterium]